MGIDCCVKVGRKITVLRIQKGMSQAVLAELAGIDRTNLSRIENGKAEPGLRTLLAIAKALNVKLADLVQDID